MEIFAGIALVAMLLFAFFYMRREDKKMEERDRQRRMEQIKRGEPVEKNNDYWY